MRHGMFTLHSVSFVSIKRENRNKKTTHEMNLRALKIELITDRCVMFSCPRFRIN